MIARLQITVTMLLISAALAACGGDNTADAGGDGSTDMSTDAKADMSLDMGKIDLGADSGLSLMPCDPTLRTSPCPAGMRCAVTLHGGNTVGYGECVPVGVVHLVDGSACGGSFQPVPGYTDVTADPCGDGLFCNEAPSSMVPRCHPICDAAHACSSGQFCIPVQNMTPAFGFCAQATNCDPFLQNCLSGQGCYILPDDRGTLYTSCFPIEPRALPDGGAGNPNTGVPGDPCTYLGNCLPGNQCQLPADGGVGTCRAFCDLNAVSSAFTVNIADADAGTDVDAAVDVDAAADVDAGDVDAAADVDAGVAADAGADAGNVDAGTNDAGATDMGTRPMPTCATGVCMIFPPNGDAGVMIPNGTGFCAP